MDDISSGDEEDDDVDGIEMGISPQICEDLDCDHTIEGNRCKSMQHLQIKRTRMKKKKVRKKSLREWVSTTYKHNTR